MKQAPGRSARSGKKRLYTFDVFILSGPMTEEFVKKNQVICRTIQIRGDQTLELLHRAIFEAFDREDTHMYEFQIGGKRPMDPKARVYSLPSSVKNPFETRKITGDLTRTTIASLGLKRHDVFGYWFDFGDDWWHQIEVARMEDKVPRGRYPKVTRRIGESPPQYLAPDEEDEDETEEPSAVAMPRIAQPTIEKVLEKFLAEHRERLGSRTARKYENVIRLLQDYLNQYAYQDLPEHQAALFHRRFNAEGRQHQEFCQLFGPAKIADNLPGFLGYFMIRKVLAGAEFKRSTAQVAGKLSRWLADNGYVGTPRARQTQDECTRAARDLPRAEKAAEILHEVAVVPPADAGELGEEGFLEFDHHTVARVEPGSVWLEVIGESAERIIGPIRVPRRASDLLEEGWEISCALLRVRGRWRLAEVANVYPS